MHPSPDAEISQCQELLAGFCRSINCNFAIDSFVFGPPVEMFLSGVSPYDAAALGDVAGGFFNCAGISQRFVYPPPTLIWLSLLFGPGYCWGGILVFILNLSVLIGLTRSVWRQFSDKDISCAVLGLLILSFAPNLILLSFGQLSALLIAVLFAGVKMLERRRWIWGGLTLSLLVMKPQLCFLVALPVFHYLLIYNGHKAIKWTLFGVCLQFAVTEIICPGITLSWLSNMNGTKGTMLEVFNPTVSDILASLLPAWFEYSSIGLSLIPTVVALIVVGLASLLRYFQREKPGPSSLLICLALSPVLAPYSLTYDHIACYPLYLGIIAYLYDEFVAQGFTQSFLIKSFTASSIHAVYIGVVLLGHPQWVVLYPFCLVCLYLLWTIEPKKQFLSA